MSENTNPSMIHTIYALFGLISVQNKWFNLLGIKGIQLNFWREVTGNFDEAEDEAEASRMIRAKTLQSDKGRHTNKDSLALFRNW